jgi:hypothetical protein
MRHLKRAAVVAAAIGALTGLVAPAAMAAPAPGFSEFNGCPEGRTDVLFCSRSTTTSGHIQLGKKDVPITAPIVLNGGILGDFDTVVANSSGGLIAPALEVPGGLTGLTGFSEWFINLITFGANKVYAKTELVGQPKVGGGGHLVLPVRVKLQNPFLSSNCAIGSVSDPLVLDATTGTTNPPLPNKPITGSMGTQGVDPKNPDIIQISNMIFVGNAFRAPAAVGCGLINYGLIDGVVNLTSGLPAAAGTNTAVLSGTTLKLAAYSLVYP